MCRPGSVRVWLAVGLLAALAACGGGGGPDRAPGGPPDLTPSPHLQFVHPVSGRALASGARFDVPDSLPPGSAMRPFILPAAESKPDPVPIAPVPITYVLERQPWPRGLVFNPRTRTLRGTLDPAVEHPPSYRFQYRASAPGHLDVHLSVVLYLPPSLRPDGFEALSFPVGRSTVTVLPAARDGRPPYAYELTGCDGAGWLRREGRSLHGSPTVANQYEPPRQCRWQVTDSAGGGDGFEIAVSVGAGPRPQLYFPAADGTPLADGAPLAPLGTLVQGEPLPPLPAFPRASGARPGTRIDYTVASAVGPPGVLGVPSGLVLDPVRRTLGGIIDDPQWPAGRYLLYYVASAPGHVDARRTVSFDLEDPLRFDAPSAGPFSFPVNEFTQRMLPQAKGGTRPHRYSLEQCPFEWLELVGSELTANPRPGHAGAKRLCRYRVTDAAGAFVEILLDVFRGGRRRITTSVRGGGRHPPRERRLAFIRGGRARAATAAPSHRRRASVPIHARAVPARMARARRNGARRESAARARRGGAPLPVPGDGCGRGHPSSCCSTCPRWPATGHRSNSRRGTAPSPRVATRSRSRWASSSGSRCRKPPAGYLRIDTLSSSARSNGSSSSIRSSSRIRYPDTPGKSAFAGTG